MSASFRNRMIANQDDDGSVYGGECRLGYGNDLSDDSNDEYSDDYGDGDEPETPPMPPSFKERIRRRTVNGLSMILRNPAIWYVAGVLDVAILYWLFA